MMNLREWFTILGTNSNFDEGNSNIIVAFWVRVFNYNSREYREIGDTWNIQRRSRENAVDFFRRSGIESCPE
jgi:hypothetical protein